MKDYKNYRWFVTSSKTLVVGGKNAEQNDELLTNVLAEKKEYTVMHTSHPGSPFCVMYTESPTPEDIAECAIFCGCFSRAWKEGKKTTNVHMFTTQHLYKTKHMKAGTWGVKGKVKDFLVPLELVLTKQKGVYRAVPLTCAKKGVVVRPGKTDKTKQIDTLKKALKDTSVSADELLSALPPGGVRIVL